MFATSNSINEIVSCLEPNTKVTNINSVLNDSLSYSIYYLLFIIFDLRYYCLLGYHVNNLTPIEILIELLTSEKTHGGVKKIVLEVIDRLLTFDGTFNDAMDVDVPFLDIPLPVLPAEYEGNDICINENG